jgi:hypothetical protein
MDTTPFFLEKDVNSRIYKIIPNATINQTVPKKGLICSKSPTKTIGNIANNHGKNRSIEKDRPLIQLLFNSVAAAKGLSLKREDLQLTIVFVEGAGLAIGLHSYK